MEVREYIDSDLSSLNILLNDVYGIEKVNCITDNVELVAIEDEAVVGYLVINIMHDSIKNISYCMVNNVCVDKGHRRKGIATKLFEKVFDICRNKNISYIELTSNETRVEAHALYKKIGFMVRDTTVFRKEFL